MKFDLAKFKDCHLLVIGDLMLDEYVWGAVDRVSPEAPVQVVSVQSEEFTLGGCGNVANNLVALGARVSAAGVVGSGAKGSLLLNKLHELGVDTRGVVQVPDRPTTRKTRIIANHQQVLRIDREQITRIPASAFDAILSAVQTIIADVDCVLISDYGKGVVTRELVKQMTDMARAHEKLTIADPKGHDFSKYAGVWLITPNKKEASLASGVAIEDEASLYKAGMRLVNMTGVPNVLITCGKDGMVFFNSKKYPIRIRSKARQVYDVSGAGDTAVSVLGLALASGLPYTEALTAANAAAGIVVGKIGTATVSPRELAIELQLIPDPTVSKAISLQDLAELAEQFRKKGQRIVLTNGCFDLLHVGHIQLLSASKKLGDVLIVAIDSDDSVRRLKGEGRPVIGVNERVKIISALDCVDFVVVFDSGELDAILETVRPGILTKGSNYESEQVYGHQIVEKHGGRVELIPITTDVSSTQIINHIKGN